MIKKWFIKKTNRETILYKIVDQVIFNLLKYKNYIINGHIIRKNKIEKYLQNHKIKKLHLGCGPNHIKGFLNSDIFGKVPIDITRKLPFKSNSLDLIYSSHLCEHIYNKDFKIFLKDSHRILKSKGNNIICMPSLEKISKILYCDKNKESRQSILNRHEKTHSLENKVFGSNYLNDMSHICFGHKYLYDFDYIEYLAKQAGYSKAEKVGNLMLGDKDIISSLKKINDRYQESLSETFILYK